MTKSLYISPTEQTERLSEEKRKCDQLRTTTERNQDERYCPVVWDDVTCWPRTDAGELATIHCPEYVYKFDPSANVTRQCMSTGQWYFSWEHNRTWSNYSSCYDDKEMVNISEYTQYHVTYIRRMYNVGYGTSLISLFIAVVIMLSFKRLYCPRNTIHLHLFMSAICRSIISLLRDNLLVAGFGFTSDIESSAQTYFIFLPNKNHWECKLFHSFFNYFILANYAWIFIEGLYLHLLIYVTTFSEQIGVRWFSALGWVLPMAFTGTWAVVRLFYEDFYCWNVHDVEGYFWILKAPIVVSILLNFFFFTSIIRVLFSKLTTTPEARSYRYRKLARSTLVLIPLFGVHYIAFLWLPDKGISETAQVARLYFEMFFNSFQGLFVACLFCFFNGEVRSECKKSWVRHRLRQHNPPNNKLTNSTGRTHADSLTHGNGQLPIHCQLQAEGHIPMINIIEDDAVEEEFEKQDLMTNKEERDF